MRILVVSDIHANYAALSAIDEPFDVCLMLGDLVDYGPDPVECVRWSMKHADHAIRGNHDHGVAQGVEVRGDHGYRYLTRATRPLMWRTLGPDERGYLLRLPLTSRFVLGGKRFLLVHGTPRDPLDEYLLKDTETWARRVRNANADIVCVGHTHMQFQIDLGSIAIVNPGSVGQPRDGDPRAAYAVIDLETNRIELNRIPYPIEDAIARMNAMPIPDRARRLYAYSLRQGRMPPPDDPEFAPEPDRAASPTPESSP